MKRLGNVLMALGLVVGVAAGVWVVAGMRGAGWPWIVSFGLVKLAVVASLGLMAAGAMLKRASARAAYRAGIRELPGDHDAVSEIRVPEDARSRNREGTN